MNNKVRRIIRKAVREARTPQVTWSPGEPYPAGYDPEEAERKFKSTQLPAWARSLQIPKGWEALKFKSVATADRFMKQWKGPKPRPTANPMIVLVHPTTDSEYDDMMEMAGSGLLSFTSLAG